jgi:hypothetical protein
MENGKMVLDGHGWMIEEKRTKNSRKEIRI